MRRTIALLICLCLGLCPLAAAEEFELIFEDEEVYELGLPAGAILLNGELVFGENSNSFGFRAEGEDCYRLMSGTGEALTEAIYTGMETSYQHSGFIVHTRGGDGINCTGLIADDGSQIMPAQYASIQIVSSRWQAGLVLKPSNGSDSHGRYFYRDPETGDKRYGALDHVDFYLNGALTGALSADEYGYGDIRGYGDYIAVQIAWDRYAYYGPGMVRSPRVTSYASEYETDYDYVDGQSVHTVYHNGTGQIAFASGCTLTAEAVQNPLGEMDGAIVDLQGRQLIKLNEDKGYVYLGNMQGGYATISQDDKEGLIDARGRVIIPIEYDDIGNYEDYPLRFGFISAEKDGMRGLLNAQGDVVADFIYPTASVRSYAGMLVVEGADGTSAVVTGLGGELDDCFDRVDYYWEGARVIGVCKDDKWALLDNAGNVVLDYIPANYLYFDAEGTMAIASIGYRRFALLSLK